MTPWKNRNTRNRGQRRERGETEDEQAATRTEEKNGDGPDEIELLFNGKRPEVRERESGGSGVVADGLRDEVGVLQVESEGEQLGCGS